MVLRSLRNIIYLKNINNSSLKLLETCNLQNKTKTTFLNVILMYSFIKILFLKLKLL